MNGPASSSTNLDTTASEIDGRRSTFYREVSYAPLTKTNTDTNIHIVDVDQIKKYESLLAAISQHGRIVLRFCVCFFAGSRRLMLPFPTMRLPALSSAR